MKYDEGKVIMPSKCLFERPSETTPYYTADRWADPRHISQNRMVPGPSAPESGPTHLSQSKAARGAKMVGDLCP